MIERSFGIAHIYTYTRRKNAKFSSKELVTFDPFDFLIRCLLCCTRTKKYVPYSTSDTKLQRTYSQYVCSMYINVLVNHSLTQSGGTGSKRKKSTEETNVKKKYHPIRFGKFSICFFLSSFSFQQYSIHMYQYHRRQSTAALFLL